MYVPSVTDKRPGKEPIDTMRLKGAITRVHWHWLVVQLVQHPNVRGVAEQLSQLSRHINFSVRAGTTVDRANCAHTVNFLAWSRGTRRRGR